MCGVCRRLGRCPVWSAIMETELTFSSDAKGVAKQNGELKLEMSMKVVMR